MHISQYFLRGDVRGAIAHMRAHEEFRDVLPAYLAIFENCEYRTYGIPAPLNDILRLYQIYFRDTFYCGLPEAEAADKLLARLKKRLDLPDADEARLTERLQAAFEAEGYHAGKRRAITAPMSGAKRSRPSIRWRCRTDRRNIPSIFSRASCSGAGWII